MRADPRWRELPFVLMASADEAAFAKETYHVGGDDVVRKPVQREELVPPARAEPPAPRPPAAPP